MFCIIHFKISRARLWRRDADARTNTRAFTWSPVRSWPPFLTEKYPRKMDPVLLKFNLRRREYTRSSILSKKMPSLVVSRRHDQCHRLLTVIVRKTLVRDLHFEYRGSWFYIHSLYTVGRHRIDMGVRPVIQLTQLQLLMDTAPPITRQLTASDVNFTIVRPLVLKYGRLRNLALVYACLVVRAHFRRLAEDNLAHSNLNHSRSLMCELLAMKCLRLFATNYFELAAVLTHSWNPLTGAPPESVRLIKKTLAIRRSDDVDILSSALEVCSCKSSGTYLSIFIDGDIYRL